MVKASWHSAGRCPRRVHVAAGPELLMVGGAGPPAVAVMVAVVRAERILRARRFVAGGGAPVATSAV